MTFSYKLTLADIACEWSFASMSAHVRLEVSGFSEFFQAALIWTNQDFGFFFWPRDLFNVLYTRLKVLRFVRCFSYCRLS